MGLQDLASNLFGRETKTFDPSNPFGTRVIIGTEGIEDKEEVTTTDLAVELEEVTMKQVLNMHRHYDEVDEVLTVGGSYTDSETLYDGFFKDNNSYNMLIRHYEYNPFGNSYAGLSTDTSFSEAFQRYMKQQTSRRATLEGVSGRNYDMLLTSLVNESQAEWLYVWDTAWLILFVHEYFKYRTTKQTRTLLVDKDTGLDNRMRDERWNKVILNILEVLSAQHFDDDVFKYVLAFNKVSFAQPKQGFHGSIFYPMISLPSASVPSTGDRQTVTKTDTRTFEIWSSFVSFTSVIGEINPSRAILRLMDTNQVNEAGFTNFIGELETALSEYSRDNHSKIRTYYKGVKKYAEYTCLLKDNPQFQPFMSDGDAILTCNHYVNTKMRYYPDVAVVDNLGTNEMYMLHPNNFENDNFYVSVGPYMPADVVFTNVLLGQGIWRSAVEGGSSMTTMYAGIRDRLLGLTTRLTNFAAGYNNTFVVKSNKSFCYTNVTVPPAVDYEDAAPDDVVELQRLQRDFDLPYLASIPSSSAGDDTSLIFYGFPPNTQHKRIGRETMDNWTERAARSLLFNRPYHNKTIVKT
jgi:hypothetical protein